MGKKISIIEEVDEELRQSTEGITLNFKSARQSTIEEMKYSEVKQKNHDSLR